MRLIHKNEFCRDIAIWYDEFLTPGENFNCAIVKAKPDTVLLTEALTIYAALARQCPDVVKYQKSKM